MKLLSLRLCEHDSNISYYDGETVRYYKSERNKKIKHHGYDNLYIWKKDIEDLWHIKIDDVDEISIIIDPERYNFSIDEDVNLFQKFNIPGFQCPVWRINHHYAHSLSGWMLNDDYDVSIVIDGYGDSEESWTVFKNDQIIEKGNFQKNGSIGISLGKLADRLEISCNNPYDKAGKVMGLQSYGNIDYDFLEKIKNYDMYSINQLFNDDLWVFHKKDPLLANLTKLDYARTIHYAVGEILLNFFKKFCKKNDRIFYSGGVAQNVIWNTLLKEYFPNLFIPPHSPDDGLSLGGLEFLRKKNKLPKLKIDNFPFVQSDQSPPHQPSNETIDNVAKLLADGNIVGWYQDQGEIGPRALGNRSILMDPRLLNGKEKINRIKKRENYRPFGASILKSEASNYFNYDNPYMLFVCKIDKNKYETISHVDETCRLQTVDHLNGKFYDLLKRFFKITSCPILLNTSLNLAGYPISGHTSDAIKLLESTDIDYVCIGNQIYKNRKLCQ